jgi:hypothetical protein
MCSNLLSTWHRPGSLPVEGSGTTRARRVGYCWSSNFELGTRQMHKDVHIIFSQRTKFLLFANQTFPLDIFVQHNRRSRPINFTTIFFKGVFRVSARATDVRKDASAPRTLVRNHKFRNKRHFAMTRKQRKSLMSGQGLRRRKNPATGFPFLPYQQTRVLLFFFQIPNFSHEGGGTFQEHPP